MRRRNLIAVLALTFVGFSGLNVSSATPERRTAVFAGGCFWSVQKVFDHVVGVTRTRAGFMGGTVDNPTYEQVAYQGNTGHLEAVEVVYDPSKVSYDTLLDAFWHSIDPTDPKGQFCDKGPHYRTALFVNTDLNRIRLYLQRICTGPLRLTVIHRARRRLLEAESMHCPLVDAD